MPKSIPDQAAAIAAEAGLHPHAEVGGFPVSWITTNQELETLKKYVEQRRTEDVG